jgi:hypothetical protein
MGRGSGYILAELGALDVTFAGVGLCGARKVAELSKSMHGVRYIVASQLMSTS